MLRYRGLIDAVMSGEATECCPVSIWQHQPGADQHTAKFAAAIVAFQNRFDCDFVKISPASTYQLRDYGLRDAWRNDPMGRRSVETRVIKDAEDWLRLPRLNPRSGFTGRLIAAAASIRRGLSDSIPVVMTVFNPLFQAVTLAGPERFRHDIQAVPDAVLTGLNRLIENTQDLIAALISDDLDGIFLASQHAQAAVLSSDLYEIYGLPGDLACLAAASELPLNILHLHGTAIHDHLFKPARNLVLHYEQTSENPSPEELQARGHSVSTGPNATLMEGDSSASAVLSSCQTLRGRCRGAPFLLAPGCTVSLSVDSSRMHAITAAARSSLNQHGTFVMPAFV